MRSMNAEVRDTDMADAKKHGLLAVDNDSDDEEPVAVPNQEDTLAKQEEMLQYVISRQIHLQGMIVDLCRQAASKSRKKDLPTPTILRSIRAVPQSVLPSARRGAGDGRGGGGAPAAGDGRYQDPRCGRPSTRQEVGRFRSPYCMSRRHPWRWMGDAYTYPGQAIPAIMSGRDVIGIAKTGSGKTIAFLLPMFRHVKDQRPVAGSEGPIAVVISPTRELAMQIYRESKAFLKVLASESRAASAVRPSPRTLPP